MTTKVLTATYTAGYTLQAPITTLRVAASGYVGGVGIATPVGTDMAYTVINGALSDSAALIAGYRGVDIDGARGSVTNYGTIDVLTRSAVRLGAGMTPKR